jgi:hypothetical protein
MILISIARNKNQAEQQTQPIDILHSLLLETVKIFI